MPRLTLEQARLVEENANLPEMSVRRFYKMHGLMLVEGDATYQDMVGAAAEQMCKLAQKFNGSGSFQGFAAKRLKWFMIDWLRENGPKARSGKARPTMHAWESKYEDGEADPEIMQRPEDRDPGFVDEWGGLEFFKFALTKLTDRERFILWMRYVEGVTLREIGEMLGVTEGRISQIETASLRKLRKDPDVIRTAAEVGR